MSVYVFDEPSFRVEQVEVKSNETPFYWGPDFKLKYNQRTGGRFPLQFDFSIQQGLQVIKL